MITTTRKYLGELVVGQTFYFPGERTAMIASRVKRGASQTAVEYFDPVLKTFSEFYRASLTTIDVVVD